MWYILNRVVCSIQFYKNYRPCGIIPKAYEGTVVIGGDNMISETEFSELGNSLVTGFFTDNVILTLTRTVRLGGLQSKDKKIIKEATQLLDSILIGGKWLENRKISSRSAETALALNRAVHALPDKTIPDDFVQHIRYLKDILVNLLQNGQETKDKIDEVRDFFDKYSRALSAESQSIIERSSEPSRIAICAPLGREII